MSQALCNRLLKIYFAFTVVSFWDYSWYGKWYNAEVEYNYDQRKANHLPGKNQLRIWRKYVNYFGYHWAKRDRHAIFPRGLRPTTVFQAKQKSKETNARPDKDIWRGQKSVHAKVNLLPAKQNQLTAGRENKLDYVGHPRGRVRCRHAAKQRKWIGQRLLLPNVWYSVCEVNE